MYKILYIYISSSWFYQIFNAIIENSSHFLCFQFDAFDGDVTAVVQRTKSVVNAASAVSASVTVFIEIAYLLFEVKHNKQSVDRSVNPGAVVAVQVVRFEQHKTTRAFGIFCFKV